MSSDICFRQSHPIHIWYATGWQFNSGIKWRDLFYSVEEVYKKYSSNGSEIAISIAFLVILLKISFLELLPVQGPITAAYMLSSEIPISANGIIYGLKRRVCPSIKLLFLSKNAYVIFGVLLDEM